MLDFYIITDYEDIPEYPNEENFIGQLSLEDLKSLKSVDEYANTLNIQLSYFEDFRITSRITRSILQFAENRINTIEKGNKACQKLIDILSKAVSCESGIVAFCD